MYTLSNFKTYLHKTYLHLTSTAYTSDEPISHSLITTNWHLPFLHVSLSTSSLFSSTVLLTFRFSFLFHIFCNFVCSVIFSGEHPAWDLVSFVLRLFWHLLFDVVHREDKVNLRRKRPFVIPRCKTNRFKNTFLNASAINYNKIHSL